MLVIKGKIIVMYNQLIHISESRVIFTCLQRPSELLHKKNFCLLFTSLEFIDFLLTEILKHQLRFALE